MNYIWDTIADAVSKEDGLRDVYPIFEKTKIDENGFTHYYFCKIMFKNPHFVIPDESFLLFEKFLDGGSREYPSDGNIPTDLVAAETRKILKSIVKISKDPNSPFYEDSLDVLRNGKFSLIRGTMKLYLGKYTTRDWRRKRFTDDIDFWIYKVPLWEHVLKKNGWIKNKKTREWEKSVFWHNLATHEDETHILIASNDTNQLLDFGGGSFLDGSSLKSIFQKKIKRGHEVDLSDIINVAMIFNKAEGHSTEEWNNAWQAFEEATNTRSKRITSNIISLCRYAYAISDYLEKVGQALIKYHNHIFDKSRYPNEKIVRTCQYSIHWKKHLKRHGFDITREMLHNFVFKQGYIKIYYARNLKHFAAKLLKLLNSKNEHLKVVFEIID
ncbi:MAG: hypothetical protein ACFFBP_17520 [Promethearchaeota archaeon]